MYIVFVLYNVLCLKTCNTRVLQTNNETTNVSSMIMAGEMC